MLQNKHTTSSLLRVSLVVLVASLTAIPGASQGSAQASHGLSATRMRQATYQPAPANTSEAAITVVEHHKKVVAYDGQIVAAFGQSVALSADILVVGAFSDKVDGHDAQGSVYLYGRNQGGPDQWGLAKKLVASDGTAGAAFGVQVAVSGDTIAVGGGGSIYVFSRDQGGPNNWGQLTEFAAPYDAMGLDQDTLVVGAYRTNIGANDYQGAAYVYERNQGGANHWGQTKQLTASDGARGDSFGSAVAISGDTIVVGAPDAGVGGIAYIFARNYGGSENWGQRRQLAAEDGQAEGGFGDAVDINRDSIVVGAKFSDGSALSVGAAYIFERNLGGSDNWGEIKKLTAADAAGWDLFGAQVSVDGNMVIIGAPHANPTSQAGKAYVFGRQSGGADNWEQDALLVASDSTAGANFGSAVDIAGNTVVIASPHDTIGTNTGQGSAHIFQTSTLSMTLSVDQLHPIPGQPLYYTVALNNTGLVSIHDIILYGALPSGLSWRGPTTIVPATDGVAGTPPNLATQLSILPGQKVTINLPVTVAWGLPAEEIISYWIGLAGNQIASLLGVSNQVSIADAPLTAQDDFALAAVNTPVSIYALSNDVDPNGDDLALTALGATLHGSAQVAGSTIVYTPTVGFLGLDTFTYTVSSTTENATATVSVLVVKELHKAYLPSARR